jgi:hypothetical protein
VYHHCLFCNSDLGANDRVESCPIGARLAFDEGRGRLWVVCPHCARWNLTPIEERFEAIETCEKLYRRTFTRVSSDNIGLARLGDGMDLIRIGKPLRPEFAAWRYSTEFFTRRQRAYAAAGATIAAAGAVSVGVGSVLGPLATATGTYAIVAWPTLGMVLAGIPMVGNAMAQDYLTFERIVGRIHDGRRYLNVRIKHVRDIGLGVISGQPSLELLHDEGWSTIDGARAAHATGVILSNTNREGASRGAVRRAVSEIESSGNAERYVATASRRNRWRRRPVSVLNRYRDFGAMSLSRTEQLALEMAMQEETERRAMNGELDALSREWRNADEIARICDNELTN